VAICVNVFLPWLAFCVIYWALSFSFHYQYPTAAWLIFALGLLAVIIAAALAYRARKQSRAQSLRRASGVA
jgi:asparagine N-glycosylation enzyme membrane subunit Stt3